MTSESIDIEKYGDLLAEVKHILSNIWPEEAFRFFETVFHDIILLFNGSYEGYRKCNTPFHDLQHTMDCLLAMARLIHGAAIEGVAISKEDAELGLIAALMHDTGYIQTDDDTDGSGAKYTMTHVSRSAEFVKNYFDKNGIEPESADFCIQCIYFTGLGSEFETVVADDNKRMLMGQILATSDLVGQMADHAYLEKLPFLASEFKEGSVPGYIDTDDLMKKTKAFYLKSRNLLKNEYGGVVKYLKSHFRERWGVDRNVYLESIQKQIDYLEMIIDKYPGKYRGFLRRGINHSDGTTVQQDKGPARG